MVCIGLALSACGGSTPPPFVSTYTVNGYQYGSRYMNTVNASVNDGALKKLEDALKASGGRLISVGQEYDIVLPTEALFYLNSPRIQWTSYGLLNKTASLLRLFNKEEVRVLVVTRATGYPQHDYALGAARARNVEDYLWGQNTGAAFMYSRSEVAAQSDDTGRVEISFRSAMR